MYEPVETILIPPPTTLDCQKGETILHGIRAECPVISEVSGTWGYPSTERWWWWWAPLSFSKSQAPGDYQVLLGNTQLYQKTQHTQKMSVNRIIKHPDFEKFHSFGSDIAMLQLRLPVNFTSYVVPACLPPKDAQLHNHTSCWITGWGMLSEDSKGKGSWRGSEGRKRKMTRGAWGGRKRSQLASLWHEKAIIEYF